MTLETTDNRSAYAGNGSTTVFSFPYYFLAQADLVVILRVNATGVETLKTLTTHYTVAGAGAGAGGSVTMLTAPAVGQTLVIYRAPVATQGVDLVENDDLPAETLEQALDKLTMLVQRLDDRMDRTVGLSDGYASTFDTTLPVLLTAGATVIVNPAVDGFVQGPTADDITAASTSATAAAASATAASTSSTLAADWATKTDGLVAATDNSAKAYAVGGTGGGQPTVGDAKSWATKTSAAVVTGEYSAKEWARGTQTRGAASGGAAKDWANYTGGTVDNTEYSAKKYAQDSSTSAAASSSSASAAAASAAAAAAVSGLTSKGDLLTHTGAANARQGVGNNNDVLISDSAQTNGIKWGPNVPAIAGLTAVVPAVDDYVSIADTSASSATKKALVSDLRNNVVATTKTTTFTATTAEDTYLLDASGGSFTANLFTAVGNKGFVLTFINTVATANKITMDGFSTETIRGALTRKICSLGVVVLLISDGANWQVLYHHCDTESTSDSTFTFTGIGTVSGLSLFTQRKGDRLIVVGSVVTGTPAASTYAFVLPSPYTIDRAKIASNTGVQTVGYCNTAAGTASFPSTSIGPFPVFLDGSNNDRVYPSASSASSLMVTANGSTIHGASGQAMTFNYSVPITDWWV